MTAIKSQETADPSRSRFARIRKIAANNDNDIGQAIVRTVLGLCASLYLGYIWLIYEAQVVSDQMMAVTAGYFIAALVILASNFIKPGHVKFRRLFCIVMDNSIVTYVLIVGGETAAPLVGGYLWTTVGNGLRFGRQSLYVSNIFSVIGMTTVLAFSEYWVEQRILGLGLMVWMLILPAYVVRLIKKLEIALANAEQASRIKSQFLANMSHELRTPLNAIIGYSGMLEEDAVSAGNRQEAQDLNKIQVAANHLLHLINEVLDLSKIEAGKIELHYERFELKPLINEVSTTLKPVMEKNNNELTMNYDHIPDIINADMTKLRQILFNILGNAGKFTRNGKVSLIVGSEKNSDVEEIVFTIQDTGIGMSSDQLSRLFSPFVQADESTTRQFGGTGLGLVISKHFCELMNGSIEVSSQPGYGSTFIIRLPVTDSAFVDERKPTIGAQTVNA